MQLTRRHLLATAAPAAALAVAGCSTTQISSFETAWASVVDTVQAAVAAAASYIPTVESIAATAASLFGPTWQAAVAAGTIVVNQIVQVLENVVNNLTPPASAALKAKLRSSSLAAPVVVGTTSTGVIVRGYKV
jgi:hypothetical protein